MKKDLFSLFIYAQLFMLSALYVFPGACAALTDPTRPPDEILLQETDKEHVTEIPKRLTAIYHYPNYKIAIIDNKVIKQGQRVGEYVVTTIKRNEVELTDKKNKRIMLKLSPSVKNILKTRKDAGNALR